MTEQNADCIFSKKTIQYGDPVVVITEQNNLKCILLKEGDVLNYKYGSMKHENLVGLTYGTKVALPKKGFIYTLPFTPELWTKTLSHRTQIIYSTDASLIVRNLELRPGKRVFEAGIGSGSLSHYLARAVWPTGKLYSFDFHEQRAQQARAEFLSHGLGEIMIAGHRDVIGDGFPIQLNEKGINELAVDAIMLDLPNPWNLIEKLSGYLKRNVVTKVCIFAPCIEQVQKSTVALRQHGFVHVNTIECLSRRYEIRKSTPAVANLGQKHVIFSDNGDSDIRYPLCSEVCSFPHPNLASNDNQTGIKFIPECVPEATMPGHTGFLTFATHLPEQ
ncbi:tRNA (adenine(58)-N(1))-methyltransferase catalytic subunit trmt61a [Cichlidogyrus casuarinus]|uniref:tRNA (adenine(58)-N(1))-methyltransferase catalytic subunit TRMT61A n=1 Tax=Cichlidogyrus casuarinus TaxID=1844966 RepID=A0ABD2QFU3_9PLAT